MHSYLKNFTYLHLRAMAAYLDVRSQKHQRKDQFSHAIILAWEDSSIVSKRLQSLSHSAKRVLSWLFYAPSVPAELFFKEFGTIRRRTLTASPATVAEELYLLGLLVPVGAASIGRSDRLALMPPLKDIIAKHLGLGFVPNSTDPAHLHPEQPSAIIHDVAQYLIFLCSQQPTKPLYGLWLSPSKLDLFNQRLLHQQPIASHKDQPYLRLLAYLAIAAGLIDHGEPTSASWLWLQQEPYAQLSRLWQGWSDADIQLRTTFEHPDLDLPAPWPALAIAHLRAQPSPFETLPFASGLVGKDAVFDAFWAAHFSNLSAIEHAVHQLLAGPLSALGIVEQSIVPSADQPTSSRWSVTAVGQRLLRWDPSAAIRSNDERATPGPEWQWRTESTQMSMPNDAAWKSGPIETESGWEIYLPWNSAPFPQSTLAAFADPKRSGFALAEAKCSSASPTIAEKGERPQEAKTVRESGHHFVLTPQSVAFAASSEKPLHTLLAAFEALGQPLSSAQIAQLQCWYAEGRWLQLSDLPIIRTQKPEQMARLQAEPWLQPLLGELLAATACTISGEPTEAVDRLRQLGYYPRQTMSTPEQDVVSTVEKRAAADLNRLSETASDTNPTERESARLALALPSLQSPPLSPIDQKELWLMLQAFQQLAHHVSLPIQPPLHLLETFAAQIPPNELPKLQALANQIGDTLDSAFDGYAMTPPPVPTDPEQWRSLIEQAISTKAFLQMSYHSAGRNLLTKRLVEPYWIEEKHQTLYLRADCHHAGRILTFRLDRIQAMEIVER